MSCLPMLRAACAALVLAAMAPMVSAYALKSPGTCPPGQKWDTSSPVKVRLLADSFFDYINRRGGQSLLDMTRIDADIKAVIALYNAVSGSGLVLQQDTGILGDPNLDDTSVDNFGTQTIVIGFTDDQLDGGQSGAEAWTDFATNGCTLTRAHIQLRKDFDWIFGPPDDLDFKGKDDGRSFYTQAQPAAAGRNGAALTFLGVLTHEMGHAVGLKHPDDTYAIMAQNFRTWLRGKDALVTRLLPDDTAGVLALYGSGAVQKPLDVSVTTTWFKSAADKCQAARDAVNAQVKLLDVALGLPAGTMPSAASVMGTAYVGLYSILATDQSLLAQCIDDNSASQVDNCAVSAATGTWPDELAGKVPCGSGLGNKNAGKVCPGGQVQVRYATNNHTNARDVAVKAEAWFSTTTTLDLAAGSALRSPDVVQFPLAAASSALRADVFRLPAQAQTGATFHVFVRALPSDAVTGDSLWDADIDQWNNSDMASGSITVDGTACH